MSNSDRVITRIGAWVAGGQEVTWTNHQPASSLVQWKRNNAKGTTPPPQMATNLSMVCYELPFWGAYHSGVWSADDLWDKVHAFDSVGHGAAASIISTITSSSWFNSTKTLNDPTTNALRKGDIVMFNGVGHVCIATGVSEQQPNEVYSVWGLDPTGLRANTPVERTSVSTILAQIAAGAPGVAQTVTYSRPSWW
ncbi:MAG: hypothetical protein AAGD13_12280 [Pseudomonadota bacterium]